MIVENILTAIVGLFSLIALVLAVFIAQYYILVRVYEGIAKKRGVVLSASRRERLKRALLMERFMSSWGTTARIRWREACEYGKHSGYIRWGFYEI